MAARFSLMLGSSHNSARSGDYGGSALHAAGLCALAGAWLLSASSLYAGAEATRPHASIERSGDLPVVNGSTLHLNADLGNIRIQNLPPGSPAMMHYAVHIETDVPGAMGENLLAAYSLVTRQGADGVYLTGALPNPRSMTLLRRMPIARNAQFWVQYTITIPPTLNLDLSSGVGDIETGDVGGRVNIVTQGGNVAIGRIGLPGNPMPRTDQPAAKIETGGGYITLKDVDGDVDVFTAGGPITAGNIDGNAKLRSGGGHIRVARIKGTALLDTEGGNITVGEAGSYVSVRTGGGQIDFGEARGLVRAQTGGGGIRVMYVAGPMEVATSSGSICLTRVANAIHAQTSDGTITAWITPDALQQGRTVRLAGASQLASRTGDIVVFVPRNIAMTIEATVDSGGPERIQADPSLPLNILSPPDGPLRAVVAINGGGAPLKLHTIAGKIRLQYADAQLSLRESLLEQEKQRLAEKLNEVSVRIPPNSSDPRLGTIPNASAPYTPSNPPPGLSAKELREGWFDSALNRLQVIFMGSLHEDETQFKQHLLASPPPVYPPLARRAGIEGLVVLQVRIKTDGSVSVDKVLQGAQTLADAAIEAVRKWKATPEQVAGKNVETVSTVSFNFTLR